MNEFVIRSKLLIYLLQEREKMSSLKVYTNEKEVYIYIYEAYIGVIIFIKK